MFMQTTSIVSVNHFLKGTGVGGGACREEEGEEEEEKRKKGFRENGTGEKRVIEGDMVKTHLIHMKLSKNKI